MAAERPLVLAGMVARMFILRTFPRKDNLMKARTVQSEERCLDLHDAQPNWGGNAMSLGTILLIVLVIVLLGGFSGFGGGPFYGTGYYGGGGLGLVLVIVLVLVLLGKL